MKRTYILAEAGVNHCGQVDVAHELVEAACRAGCDAVKFQLFRTDALSSAKASCAPYQGDGRQDELLKKLELSQEAMASLAEHARQVSLDFVCSPFDLQSAEFLCTLGVPFIKVPSGEITHLRYLRQLGALGYPLVVSTGTASLGETETALEAIRKGQSSVTDKHGRWEGFAGDGIALLHCVTSYPAPVEQTDLLAMEALAAAFPYPVGYSDHTVGSEVAIAAVARGACIIEKHFTLDKTMEGPDHAASANPSELEAMVAAIRRMESAMGDGRKRPAPCELENRRAVRRRLCAARPIRPGHALTQDDLIALRADGGIGAEDAEAVIGRPIRRAVSEGEPLSWDDL